jgi:hypothetical protein
MIGPCRRPAPAPDAPPDQVRTTLPEPPPCSPPNGGSPGVAHLLDDLVTVPGTKSRVGLDPIVGLIPVVGDLTAAVLGAWIVLEAARFKVPGIVLIRMSINTFVDFLIGLIPFVGDILDFGFKGNRMNLELFHRYALDPGEDTSGQWALILGVLAVLIGLGWLALVLAAKMFAVVFGALS